MIWRCPAWLHFLDQTAILYLKARLITTTKGPAALDAYVASYFGFVDEGIGSHVAEVQVTKGSITSQGNHGTCNGWPWLPLEVQRMAVQR